MGSFRRRVRSNGRRGLQSAFVILALASAGCSEDKPAPPTEQSIAQLCGIPDLNHTIRDGREYVILEHEIEGTMLDGEGNVFVAPPSDREKEVLKALPCLKREAESRGLTLNNSERPMIHVDD